MPKEVWNKTLIEMEFDEIVDWATGKIVFGLIKGVSIHTLVYEVLQSLTSAWYSEWMTKRKEEKK
jgi:hypothetical protein